MKVDLVRIGNSRGIRIPKPLIEQCGFGETAELSIEKGRLVIAPERRPRAGWKEAFASAGKASKDRLLLEAVSNEFDREEWEW